MKTASFLFLFIGAIVVVGGHWGYMQSHMSPANKLGFVTAIIPGWSLIVMGWCGLLYQDIMDRARHLSGSGS